MKTRTILSALLLVAVLLSACQSATPTAAPEQSTPVQNTPAPEQVYPAPQEASAVEAYPAPENAPVQKPGVLYPEPKSGDEVSWSQVYGMLLNKEITQVLKSATGQITITLSDGRSLISKEPNAGDIEKAIQACGETCKNITVQAQ